MLGLAELLLKPDRAVASPMHVCVRACMLSQAELPLTPGSVVARLALLILGGVGVVALSPAVC